MGFFGKRSQKSTNPFESDVSSDRTRVPSYSSGISNRDYGKDYAPSMASDKSDGQNDDRRNRLFGRPKADDPGLKKDRAELFSDGSHGQGRNEPSRYDNSRNRLLGRPTGYSRTGDSQERGELFGDDPQSQEDNGYSNRYVDNEQDPELRQVKQQIRDTKMESVESTRRAVQMMNETMDSAGRSIQMLGEQGEKLSHIDSGLNTAKKQAHDAADKAEELRQLNRSIFIPVFKKSSKKNIPTEIPPVEDSQQERFRYGSRVRTEQGLKALNRPVNASSQPRSEADRRRYNFEGDEVDDMIEDEINQNLDLISQMASNLKMGATSMNKELTAQNDKLTHMTGKVDPISDSLTATNRKINKTR